MVVFATLTITPVLWLVITCILANSLLQRLLLHPCMAGSDEVLWMPAVRTELVLVCAGLAMSWVLEGQGMRVWWSLQH